ncbi:haloacid dehalogenase-like hydrolase domain-containing protein [Sarocladium implicatum]|nr:haloacid dehalogenase-like hydrolase domain-containing protein [Sarocladium implicatum]
MHLVFDFDGTITQKDTIGVLVDYALAHQREQGREVAPRWNRVLEAYGHDAQVLKEHFRPKEAERTTLDGQRAFLSAQYDVDEASLSRVSASGIFANINKDTYFRFGQDAVESGKVQIRPGFRELVAHAAAQDWMVHVISVNWSREFIAGALHPLDPRLIITNSLAFDGTIQGPDILQRKLTSPWDKLDALKAVTAGDADKVVYFGDSANDVECLIKGGVAIADCEDTSLLRMLRRVGVQTPRLASQTDGNTVPWASDFDEFMKANEIQ